MKKLFFMFVILFSAVLSPFGSASAEENSGKSWVSKADLPEVRSAAATAVVDGKIYVIGGFGSENIATNTTYVYDPKTNEWTQKTDMPTKRAGAAVAVVDHKIYVIGGNTFNTSNYANTEKVEIYDYKTDTWERGVDAPVKSYLSSAAVIDNTIHLFTQQGPSMPTHFAYNTATKKWETKYRQPRNNSGAAAATVNGKYII
ncbi:Kelch repeat-containing protein [Bacillus paralicheniformis]|uniref:Kelch repeat-containing protein n=1 Tax=Bacillus paralicheniformis TaxID=1648923 RepID=UPI0021BD0BC3|nr:kelch repeat-containing protein [Bacillus paralicheniformis]